MIFAGFGLNFTGFRHQTELKSRKIRSTRRSFRNFREEASPRANQERPRSSKEGPRGSQGGPVGCQEGPRGATGGLLRRPGDTSETISALRQRKKSSFESSRWRESLEKRIRCDFLLILEARAQTRRCKKRVKTCVFPMFFVGRVFFEKVSTVQGKRMKKW